MAGLEQIGVGKAAKKALMPDINIPEPSAPAPVPVMPIPDDDAVKAAKKKATQLQQRRKGRLSTILSETGDITTLGG